MRLDLLNVVPGPLHSNDDPPDPPPDQNTNDKTPEAKGLQIPKPEA